MNKLLFFFYILHIYTYLFVCMINKISTYSVYIWRDEIKDKIFVIMEYDKILYWKWINYDGTLDKKNKVNGQNENIFYDDVNHEEIYCPI